MPTYQYACTQCDHFFEQFQSFTDDALTECPQCEGRLRKVFNAVGVVFKGSGFYRTDSRASASGENGSSKASDAGSSGSSDKGAGSTSGAASTGSSSGTGSSSSGSSSSGSSSTGSSNAA